MCEGAKLRNADGEALNTNGARVEGSLILRAGAQVEGVVDLIGSEIAAMNDDPACWPARLRLDRCVYGAFVGNWEANAGDRIAWLDRHDPAMGFRAQPWEQCAKVLREMGHPEDARAVLIEKERRQRRARRLRMRDGPLRHWRRATDGLLGAVVGYGYRPTRAFVYAAVLWLVGAGVFLDAWREGGFMPNSAFLLRAPEWVRCGAASGEPMELAAPGADGAALTARGLRGDGQSQLDCWLTETAESRSLSAFHALVYSADALLPVVEFGQEATWTPDPDTPAGAAARVWLWLQILAGWALSLLAVAGFSGIVTSD